MTMDARVTRVKKFLHKIIDLNQQEQQEAELRTRIAQHLSGRVRPPDAAMQKELLCKGSSERVRVEKRKLSPRK